MRERPYIVINEQELGYVIPEHKGQFTMVGVLKHDILADGWRFLMPWDKIRPAREGDFEAFRFKMPNFMWCYSI